MKIINANYFIYKEIKNYLLRNHKYLGLNLLDFGCGESPYFELLQPINYTGVDLEINQNSSKKNLIKIVANKSLPFEDATFDSIISTQVIYQVKELDKLIIDFYRVLNKNGVVLVTVPFMWFEVYKKNHLNKRFSKNELQEIFEQRGFKLINFKPLNVGLEGILILLLKSSERKLNKLKIRVLRVPIRVLFNLVINFFLYLLRSANIFNDSEIYLNSGFIFQKVDND
jgi:SAM-dependent methyltransferase